MSEKLLAYHIFALSAAATPGPSNVLVMSVGGQRGVVGALPCLCGVVVGMAVLIYSTSAGLGAALVSAPLMIETVKWVGAGFLLRMAWKVAKSTGGAGESKESEVGFVHAFVFQWVNPKSWIVGVSTAAALADFVAQMPILGPVLLGLTFAAAAAPSCLLWLLCGATLKRWLTNERRAKAFARTMGTLLALSVVLIVR